MYRNLLYVMNFITGEAIQQRCDLYIGQQSDLSFNPTIRKQSYKWIDVDTPDMTKLKMPVTRVFCYPYVLHIKFYETVKILKKFTTPFDLYIHNGDDAVDKEHSSTLFSIPNIKRIYAQNLNTRYSDRLIPLPIGLGNSQWNHGKLNMWRRAISQHVEKDKCIYFYCNHATNSEVRNDCASIMKSKGIQETSLLEMDKYIPFLSRHKYAICPRGNGIDTHRFWECLYSKVVPIVIRTNITDYYQKWFPMIVLNKWEDLDKDSLERQYDSISWDNYDCLDLDKLLMVI